MTLGQFHPIDSNTEPPVTCDIDSHSRSSVDAGLECTKTEACLGVLSNHQESSYKLCTCSSSVNPTPAPLSLAHPGSILVVYDATIPQPDIRLGMESIDADTNKLQGDYEGDVHGNAYILNPDDGISGGALRLDSSYNTYINYHGLTDDTCAKDVTLCRTGLTISLWVKMRDEDASGMCVLHMVLQYILT